MHEKIVDVQNSFWKAYKDFYETRDMRKYNQDVDRIVSRYVSNPSMLQFCQNLVFAWAPVVNEFKEWT